MKITIKYCAACFILMINLTVSASENIVSSFQGFLAKATMTTETNEPVFENRKKEWAKRKFNIIDYTYDIKKTDSLVNQIIGVVSFKLIVNSSEFYLTKKDAQLSQVRDNENQGVYDINLIYSYKGGKWHYLKGYTKILTKEMIDIFPGLKTKVFDIIEREVKENPHTIPDVAILYWLPN
jgi:hypothetical protein